MKVLLVEDDEAVASFIKRGLKEQSYDVYVAYDGQMGKKLAMNNHYDIIIMDLNLPHINGFELSKMLRDANNHVPILMLTALDSTDDKLEGFESGADDYLVKPFDFLELLARMKALRKRYFFEHNVTGKTVKVFDLELDLTNKAAKRAGEWISLSSKEYSLLEYLVLNRGKVISRAEISEKVWELNFDTGSNVIEVYIAYLRKKIDKDHPLKLIQTVVGKGYVIR